ADARASFGKRHQEVGGGLSGRAGRGRSRAQHARRHTRAVRRVVGTGALRDSVSRGRSVALTSELGQSVGPTNAYQKHDIPRRFLRLWLVASAFGNEPHGGR